MYLGNFLLDQNIEIGCNTHNPNTGVAQDADAPPTYRVYKDNADAPILNGVLALRDGANTTGLYRATLALTVANGFANGSHYTVYIQAVVAAVTGTLSHSFTMGPIIPVGAIEFTYTVTNSVTGLPEADCEVWITTDLAGTNVIWHGFTDAFGVARDALGQKPWLDAGDYAFWRHKAGYTDIDPDVETVS